MTLWVVFGALSLVAIGFAVWPLYSRQQRFSGTIVLSVVVIVALSAGLYSVQGSPDIPSGVPAGAAAEMDEVIAALAERLESNPDDLNGWKMLGRSYMALGNYSGAIEAYERANTLEAGRNAQTLVSLGEARLANAGGVPSEETSGLFESALAIDPNNPAALFYAGSAAASRNDLALAANRWERLLSLNPPPEIESTLRQQIAAWRGEPAPAEESRPMPETDAPARPQAALPEDVIVSARISLSQEAMASLQQDAIVFILARDPAQPTPPIAVTRAMLSQFPVEVAFTDDDSMMQGRTLSMYPEFELVARVAVSGQRTQQPGDWFGSVIVRPAENRSVDVTISEQVP
jgi:cytochrome c-type biogenesis protein CcmH